MVALPGLHSQSSLRLGTSFPLALVGQVELLVAIGGRHGHAQRYGDELRLVGALGLRQAEDDSVGRHLVQDRT